MGICEGITMEFSKKEMKGLMRRILDLSVPGSQIAIGLYGSRKYEEKRKVHELDHAKFHTNDPKKFLTKLGWGKVEIAALPEIDLKTRARKASTLEEFHSFYFCPATKEE